MPEPDIRLCFKTMPPCLTPVSERAKKLISLPENIDGVILLKEDAMEAMGAIPGDYVMEKVEEPPKFVAIIEELKTLH